MSATRTARLSTGGVPPRRRDPNDNPTEPTPTPSLDTTPRTHPGDASTLLHLAPPSLTALTAKNQLKAFIIDYCRVNAFPHTAEAFARESEAFERLDLNNLPFGAEEGARSKRDAAGKQREGLDRDGDEAMNVDDVSEAAEGTGETKSNDESGEGRTHLSKEDLDSITLRRGTLSCTSYAI